LQCPKINSYIPGRSTILISSCDLGWKEISLELHAVLPGESEGSLSADHLIALFIDHVARVEMSGSSGHFVPNHVHPGSINLFPAGPVPAYRLFTPAKVILCALAADFINEISKELDTLKVMDLKPSLNLRDNLLRGIVLLLSAEVNSGGATGKLYADHLVHALALRFLNIAGGRITKKSQHGKMPKRILQRVLDRMKAEMATNIDINTLAAESGYSRSHFLHMFRAEMGCSPHQWLTRLRIEEAKKMLWQDSFSLFDIAVTCGFSHSAHFSSRFRQIVGVTPSEYRRSRR
jgi:AraC family transcriptional regulator